MITSYIERRDRLNPNLAEDRMRLDQDPDMQAELGRQDADLRMLAGTDGRAKQVQRLRQTAERSLLFDFGTVP